MEAAEIIAAIAELISALGPLAVEAAQAASAGDQASLDALQVKIVAASNVLAPAGGLAPVAVS